MHLMTGLKGTVSFVSPRLSGVEGFYTSHLKNRTNCEKIVCLTPAGSQICRGSKMQDLITCRRKSKMLFRTGVSKFCSH